MARDPLKASIGVRPPSERMNATGTPCGEGEGQGRKDQGGEGWTSASPDPCALPKPFGVQCAKSLRLPEKSPPRKRLPPRPSSALKAGGPSLPPKASGTLPPWTERRCISLTHEQLAEQPDSAPSLYGLLGTVA